MSLLGKLFGGRTLEQERAHADALFGQEDFGPAKLAYERAASLAKGQPDMQRELLARAEACANAIAKQQLAEAERMAREGSLELAFEALRQVELTAADPALQQLARERMELLERAVVRAEVAEHTAPNEEDRFELIAGGFENDQYAEYLAHGDNVKQALLLLHDGETTSARALLEEVIKTADGPRYLWFELGRARLADNDLTGGQEALESFLASLHEDEGGDARLLARTELAQLARAKGDFDGAVAHFEAALTAAPEDPRPYLAMASFFRQEKLHDEAVEVLEAGLEAVHGRRPDVRLWQELGLTLAEQGKDAEAIKWLERMVELLSSQKLTDMPPEGTAKLAELHERAGRNTRALDLYSLLAHGSDVPRLFHYHEQAARLLLASNMVQDARRMLLRALELAPDDAAVKARIQASLKATEAAT
jgi:tetratricopeptide (TPR) repeat protein